MELKQGAVYRLPNGRELVAYLTGGDRAILYNLTASEPGKYELNSEGRLLLNGRLTAWGVNELFDTGRIAPPDVADVLVATRAVAGGNTDEQSI